VSVALGIQHTKRMRPFILSVACLVVHIFPLYVISGKIFGGKKLLNAKCVFWFSLQYCLKHFSIFGKKSVRYYYKFT